MRQEENDRINITKSSMQEETKKPNSISKNASRAMLNAGMHPSLWKALQPQQPTMQKSQS